MKKFLYFLPILAVILFTACSDDDDNVASNFTVNVEVTVSDHINLSEVNDLTVTAVNLQTAKEQKANPSDGKVTFTLPTGEYDFLVTGTFEGHDVNGVLSKVAIHANVSLKVNLDYAAVNSTLLFKEVYFTGVKDFYFKDGFYEIYNNSDEIQYLDGVILGIVDEGLPVNTYLPANSIWVNDNGELLNQYPMTNYTMYFPGNGTQYPIEPGKSIIVAATALNHKAVHPQTETDNESPVDLSRADWETYCKPHSISDTDIEGVPNMEYAFHTFGLDFMPGTSGGNALILAKLPNGMKVSDFVANEANFMTAPGKSQKHLMIPSEYIIDAIDIVHAPASERFKHLKNKDDMGMTWVDGSNNSSLQDAAYSGKSLRRKVASIENGMVKYKDTNNSSIDFITGGLVPTPGIHPTSTDK